MDWNEPVLKRSRWGTNRYVYNADNPLGMVLIVLSVVVTVIVLVMLQTRSGPFAVEERPAPDRPAPSVHVPDAYLPDMDAPGDPAASPGTSAP
ncbi:hypothetical protein [Streptomyces sp. t39]|uniref:hypothetical protein n=1 Tax=Streptomyces sp. t39 TaxID=1828156 RepID=UPI0011CE294A|nr:hypothetical protein [Streptomyces sp. t39]TXS56563.1 hypothetical protein EAO77_10930 [Streptomyces sp. t39]